MDNWLLVAVGVLVVGTAFAGFGAWIAAEKGREPMQGAVVGFLFGPLGVLVLALLPGVEERKPRAVREAERDWKAAEAKRDAEEENRALRYLDGSR